MRFINLSLAVTFLLLNATSIFAQQKANYTPEDKSPEEIMRYVKQAVAFVQENGENAYSELTDPNGPWVEGDWYIYVNSFKGLIVAHLNQKLVGKNFYGVRDVKGNPFFAQLQEIAHSERGYGWTEFWWPKPNSTTPAQKIGFVMRVPGQEIWVGTGIYDMEQKDIDKILREQNTQ